VLEKEEKAAIKDDAHGKMCKMARRSCFKDGTKNLKGRCGSVWEWCEKEIEAHTKRTKRTSLADEAEKAPRSTVIL
jgi:hypothetical protein